MLNGCDGSVYVCMSMFVYVCVKFFLDTLNAGFPFTSYCVFFMHLCLCWKRERGRDLSYLIRRRRGEGQTE